MIQLKVAGNIIKLDIPDLFIEEYMPLFEDASSVPDITIALSHEKELELPRGAVLETDVPIHTLYSNGNTRYYVRTRGDGVTYVKYDKACTDITLNINSEIDMAALHLMGEEDREELRVDVSSVLRRVFIMLLAARGGVCVHSASLEYSGGAVVFCAKSGTGKTTHTNQWREAFPGAEMINGDNGYCFAGDGGAVIHGAPWCGTSGQCRNVSVPVKAFVFLEQAPENSIRRLSAPEAFMRLTAGCFLPAWDKNLMLAAVNTAEKLASSVSCYHLKCLPNQDAARVAEREIWKV